ncbi:MAG: DUF4886 domain-containing protein [Sphingobacteriales bacterium]|nr:MAG: DUF4886 domain-containing protein [Sphingobacteriales bacterium]
MKRQFTFLLFLASLGFSNTSFAIIKKVLFIGNSYIYTNDVPALLEQLCTANGDVLIKDQNTPGGYSFQAHNGDQTTLDKINSNSWDVVILQEQSQRPAFPQSQVEMQVYPYALLLVDKVKFNNPCSEVMFMMTWGYKNGDASNCGFYPPICTYDGMQDGLRFSYMKMGQDNNSNVAPIGAAWKVMRDSFPNMELYSPDESHPSLNGSYLEACVLYASIFHKTPVGNTFTAGLPVADVATFQRIAAKVTLDSLEQWKQYGNMALANFTSTQTGSTVNFQNLSKRATSYLWDLGDGNTSTLQDPVHTYAPNAIYNVKLTATNSCNEEVYTGIINTFPTSVGTVTNAQMPYVYMQDGRNYLKLDANAGYDRLRVYDLSGKELLNRTLLKGELTIPMNFATGIYIYKLQGVHMATGKFSLP